MPPRPSSPFSRSVTKATALRMALSRPLRGNHGWATRSTASTPLKNRPQAERYGPRIQSRTCSGGVRNSSRTCTPRGLRAVGRKRHQHQQRHDHRARPVRHLGQVEREPQRQVHDLQRHHRHGAPRHLAEQGELSPGEDVGALGPAGLEDRGAGAGHVRGVRVVADRLQRVIRLHAGRQVEGAIVEQRPAAVLLPWIERR